jgi:biotin operon repressor
MSREAKHAAALARTKSALATPMTTKEAAEALGTTIPTIVAHIAALRRQGVKITEKRVRLSLHGPPAVRYAIATEPAEE